MSRPSSVSAAIAPAPAPLFINDREVARRLGCARATIWRAVHNDAAFPRPVRLLGRRVAWRVSEIEEWAAGREGSR